MNTDTIQKEDMMTTDKGKKYKYQDITGKVLNCAFEVHYAQTLNYLRAIGYEVGLILNFAKPKLEYKRVVV